MNMLPCMVKRIEVIKDKHEMGVYSGISKWVQSNQKALKGERQRQKLGWERHATEGKIKRERDSKCEWDSTAIADLADGESRL